MKRKKGKKKPTFDFRKH